MSDICPMNVRTSEPRSGYGLPGRKGVTVGGRNRPDVALSLTQLVRQYNGMGASVRRTKRLEITVETDESIVITPLNSAAHVWCRDCNQPVRMLAPEAAARLSGVSWREISRRVEGGRLHFKEMADGRLLICANSLCE
jgi:hypothetical protein